MLTIRELGRGYALRTNLHFLLDCYKELLMELT